jgi:osmotically-inducible protein OsmY
LAGDDVQIVKEGNVAILQGSVQSSHTAELLVQMVAFEPGIDQVLSQLEVASEQIRNAP